MRAGYPTRYQITEIEVANQQPGPANEVVPTMCLAVAAIGFAPLLHLASPILAICVETLTAIAIALAAPPHAPAVAIFVLFFQNLFISLMSPLIAEPADVDFIKGYNFLCCSGMWLGAFTLYVLSQRNQSAELDRLMNWSIATLAIVGLYFLIGVGQDSNAALAYLRNIVLPLFLFQLSLLTAASYRVRATPFLLSIAVIVLLLGYIEFAFRDFWLGVTNGYRFWGFEELKAAHSGAWEAEMRATGFVPVDMKDHFKFDFLNTPLLEGFGLSQLLRINGPNMTPISFAYGVGFFCLFAFSVRRPLLALAALPLLIVCSVKGALITVFFVGAAWISTRLLGAILTLALGLIALGAFAVVAIHIGLQIGDYHVLGLMGGFRGFLEKPFGRGLGTGGNLSSNYFSIDWGAAQQVGTIDGAAESAVGVMLYQMGVAALLPIGFYLAVAFKAWRLYASSGNLTQGLAGFGILVVLLNGTFQEEALFSPLGLGLLLSLAGLVIGSQIRSDKVLRAAVVDV